MDHRPEKTAPYVRGATPEVREVAQRMRWSPTPTELALWNAISGKQLDGLRFRRQHPIGPFVLDFYCPSARLAVELDGSIHLDPDQAIRDLARTEQLGGFGIRVIRFENDEVLNNLPSVLARIVEAAGEA